MNMQLGRETADALNDKINALILESMGQGILQTESTEDLNNLADSLTELSEKLRAVSNYAEDKIEEAHLRRGVDVLGNPLTDVQITYWRNRGDSWVGTVECECGVGEFCWRCGVGVLPGIKFAVAEFLGS